MKPLRTLESTIETGNEVINGGYGFDPFEKCLAVHPTNGEQCICRGLHAQHWAIYPGGNERTVFSSWVGKAPSPVPPKIINRRIYPMWQKRLIKLAAFIATGLVIGLGCWLLSELEW